MEPSERTHHYGSAQGCITSNQKVIVLLTLQSADPKRKGSTLGHGEVAAYREKSYLPGYVFALSVRPVPYSRILVSAVSGSISYTAPGLSLSGNLIAEPVGATGGKPKG
jgi:hypothetical protein